MLGVLRTGGISGGDVAGRACAVGGAHARAAVSGRGCARPPPPPPRG